MKRLLFFFTFVVFCPLNAQVISWQKSFGGSGMDFGYSLLTTADGGYILGGYTYSSANGDITGVNKGGQDAWLVKLDAAGAISWQKNLGGSGSDGIYNLQKTSDGGYVFVGSTSSSANGDVTGVSKGSNDVWVVKLTSTGAITWQKNLGGASSDAGYFIQQTTDGGYIVSGITSSSASGDVTGTSKGTSDAWIVKLTSAGAISWQKNLGGSANEYAYSIKQTSDGGYIVTGLTASSASGDVTGASKGGTDVWVVKLTSAGATSWQKNLGGSGNESSFDIQQTTDGGYILCGTTSSSANGDVTGASNGAYDAWIVKLTSTGAISWQKNLGGSGNEYMYAIIQTSDGGYAACGYTTSSASVDVTGASNGGTDAWIIKLSSSGNLIWQKNYGGSATEDTRDIMETSNGGLMVFGTSDSSANGDVADINKGNFDFWMFTLDASSLSAPTPTKKPVILYPNPSKDFLIITNLTKGKEVCVFDTAGKLIYQTKSNNTSLTINVSSYKAGVYLVKVNGEVLKLLKQ